MKKLLREFLSYILTEERIKHNVGDVWQTPSKKWSAKRAEGPGGTQSGFDNEESARRWLSGKGPAPGKETPSGKQKRPARAQQPTPRQRPLAPQAPSTPSAASGFLSRVRNATQSVIGAVNGFRDMVYKLGGVGTGTEDSTKGEQSSCSAAEDFIGGRVTNGVPIPGGISDEDIETARAKLTRPKPGVQGEPDETHRAVREAWIARETQRYIDGGTTPPSRKWLMTAYKSGLSTRAALEQRADMAATQAAIRDGTLPPPMVTNEGEGGGKAAATTYLTGLRDATPEGSEERAHYDKILLALETAEDTDTCMFYIRPDGKVSALFVSNKQGINDPHGNTGPKARIDRIGRLAATSGLDARGQEELGKAIKDARDAIGASVEEATAQVKKHFDNQSEEDRAAADDRLRDLLTGGLPADRGRTKDYTEDILDFPPVKEQLRNIYCSQNPDSCQGKKPRQIDDIIAQDDEFRRANIGTAFRAAAQENPNHGGIRKILIKLGTVATGPDDERLLGPVLTVGSSMKAAAADAHSTIVSRVHQIDKSQCGDSWDDKAKACVGDDGKPKNGPATQTYVDAYMRDTHWDQYMCTDAPDDDCSAQGAVDETKLVDIDGHKVAPAKFRECLADLTGFEHEGEDRHSPENQRALWRHLKGVLRVDSEEDSISVHGEGGRQVGRERYRTKGAASSLLTYLGRDMANCVTGKTE